MQRFSQGNLTGDYLKTFPGRQQVILTVTACQPDGAACAAQDNTMLLAIEPYQLTL